MWKYTSHRLYRLTPADDQSSDWLFGKADRWGFPSHGLSAILQVGSRQAHARGGRLDVPFIATDAVGCICRVFLARTYRNPRSYRGLGTYSNSHIDTISSPNSDAESNAYTHPHTHTHTHYATYSAMQRVP